MRLGIVTFPRPIGSSGGQAVLDRAIELAQACERYGLAGFWTVDALGRGFPTVDPLMLLSAVCRETHGIELGTCVLQVPLRHPVELAHRVQTLNLLSGGRLRLGVGAGSTVDDFQATENAFEGRFETLPRSLQVMRETWRGKPVFGQALPLWPGTEGGPPLLIGAWRSPRWIRLAAELDGWIASGIHTGWEDIETGARMFRDAGGERTVVANIFTDLRAEPVVSPLAREAQITLMKGSDDARSVLARLADLGVDDALLIVPFDAPDQVEKVGELL